MKIAISADGADVQARVSDRLGMAQYLVIIDLETGEFNAVPGPAASGQRGAGMQVVVLAMSKDVNTVVTGYCPPAVYTQLTSNGIEVLTGLKGSVGEILEQFKGGDLGHEQGGKKLATKGAAIDRAAFVHALTSSARQFSVLLPVLIGVVLCIGLFNTFVSKGFLLSLFSGNVTLDTLWGACFGSVFAGNPINSYVIGGELLKQGVSLFAVTALMVTWVTVGLLQLPAEIAAFGRKFALLRNGICFVLSLPVAMLTVGILNLVTG